MIKLNAYIKGELEDARKGGYLLRTYCRYQDDTVILVRYARMWGLPYSVDRGTMDTVYIEF